MRHIASLVCLGVETIDEPLFVRFAIDRLRPSVKQKSDASGDASLFSFTQ
ncbi:hypothetical protein A33K_17569 [Burkholderia humptydooensis MSMB43]|uniref:Uncharacterized protein n=1 Tax=Burkholderia humptydooensis MSMB43 TaxID=441157 RepID=A0ABN0FZV5_9BURK|nr:hypothetical protein A33K_17569 [Burkholderia humptydooensis MSMB43]